MSVPVTAFYASLMAVFYLYLSLSVSLVRRDRKIGMGDGGDNHFRNKIRAHANFNEYVPIILLLLLVAELNGVSELWLHISGVTILCARVLHAYGLGHHLHASWQRFYGATLTYLAVAMLVVLNLLKFY